MTAARAKDYVPYNAFLRNEAASAERHEWVDGVVYAMSRGSPEHGRLTNRVTIESQVRRRPLHDEHGAALPMDPVVLGESSLAECKDSVRELPDYCAEKRPVKSEPSSPSERHGEHPSGLRIGSANSRMVWDILDASS